MSVVCGVGQRQSNSLKNSEGFENPQGLREKSIQKSFSDFRQNTTKENFT